MNKILVRVFLLATLIAGGLFSSGCIKAYATEKATEWGKDAAGKGADKLEEYLAAEEKKKYNELAVALKAKGKDITDVDTDNDGKTSPDELAAFAIKNPTDVIAYWQILAALVAYAFGAPHVKKLREKYLPKKPALPNENNSVTP